MNKCCPEGGLCPQHLQQLQFNLKHALRDMLDRRHAGTSLYERQAVVVA